MTFMISNYIFEFINVIYWQKMTKNSVGDSLMKTCRLIGKLLEKRMSLDYREFQYVPISKSRVKKFFSKKVRI